jgi:hypothetical protein
MRGKNSTPGADKYGIRFETYPGARWQNEGWLYDDSRQLHRSIAADHRHQIERQRDVIHTNPQNGVTMRKLCSQVASLKILAKLGDTRSKLAFPQREV